MLLLLNMQNEKLLGHSTNKVSNCYNTWSEWWVSVLSHDWWNGESIFELHVLGDIVLIASASIGQISTSLISFRCWLHACLTLLWTQMLRDLCKYECGESGDGVGTMPLVELTRNYLICFWKAILLICYRKDWETVFTWIFYFLY